MPKISIFNIIYVYIELL